MKKIPICFCMLICILTFHLDSFAVNPVSVTTPNGERVTLQPFKTGAYQVLNVNLGNKIVPAYGVLYYCQMDGCCMIGLDILVENQRIRKSIGMPEDWTYDSKDLEFSCDYEDDIISFVSSISPLRKGEQMFTYVGDDLLIGLVYSLKGFKKYKKEVVMRKILELD